MRLLRWQKIKTGISAEREQLASTKHQRLSSELGKV